MKHNHLKSAFLLFLAMNLFFHSCTHELENPAQDATKDIITEVDSKYKAIIEALGFDTSEAFEWDNYIVVEGDILFDKDKLLNLDVTTRQAHSDYLISFENRYNMHVWIDYQSMDASWINAFTSAIAEWNSLGGVYMTYQPYTSMPAISITPRTLTGAYAQASFPTSDGKPGSTIYVDTRYNLTASQKKLIAVHELGHCIGFRHTDWRSNGEAALPAVPIPGTPNTGYNDDAASIMNSYIGGQNWNGFSSYDKVAHNYMYPPVHINGPRTIFRSATYTATNIPAGQQISWYGMGTNNATGTSIVVNNSASSYSTLTTVGIGTLNSNSSFLRKEVLHFVSGYQTDYFDEIHIEIENNGPIVERGRIWVETGDGIFQGARIERWALSNDWDVYPEMNNSCVFWNKREEPFNGTLTIDIEYTDALNGTSYASKSIEIGEIF